MALDFLKDATNVIVVGPNGVGKSTLARNIAHHAASGSCSAISPRSTATPPCADACVTTPRSTGHRRVRLSLLLQPPCRSAVRTRQSPLRAQEHAQHYQSTVRRMARGAPQRRPRPLPRGPPRLQRRDPGHRGRSVPPQGSTGTSRAARPETQASQVMTKSTTRLPFTVTVQIPTYWTTE